MNFDPPASAEAPAPSGAERRPSPVPDQVPGWSSWTLRVLVLIVAVLVLWQAVSAGLFVTGDVGLLTWHSATASFLYLLVLLQFVAAILVWRPGRGPAWPMAASLALFFLTFFQAGIGYGRVLSLHIPGGALLFGLTTAMLIATWSSRLRVRRSAPQPKKEAKAL
jgi:hypothetical protein